ncbi:hypothetical protein CpipJ_CPIJ012240 [Culex quinquefasciatus]|uniref:Uncharacterized protein n=1 Tax=Culex quinquefasciatus TaxID=7176 RepID=B0WY08_CULQU|nr:hypothetical protein CpipJ_CPIJ012240 [Culex quinquefasciatus]|eukprot:XP_001862280.1 hypothetical protein CpipJ_CPIJ012240 [Culex quinquefasciatus]
MREGSSHSFFSFSALHQGRFSRPSGSSGAVVQRTPASLDLHESHTHSSIRAKFRRTSHFTLGILPSGGTSLNIRPPLVVSAERARCTPASFRYAVRHHPDAPRHPVPSIPSRKSTRNPKPPGLPLI